MKTNRFVVVEQNDQLFAHNGVGHDPARLVAFDHQRIAVCPVHLRQPVTLAVFDADDHEVFSVTRSPIDMFAPGKPHRRTGVN